MHMIKLDMPLDPSGLTQIENLFKKLVQISVSLAFVALFVVLLWAGIKYLTSGGEPKALQSTSQTVTWALLGMLFLIIAWLILLLIEAFTGVQVTNFTVKLLCLGAGAGSGMCPP